MFSQVSFKLFTFLKMLLIVFQSPNIIIQIRRTNKHTYTHTQQSSFNKLCYTSMFLTSEQMWNSLKNFWSKFWSAKRLVLRLKPWPTIDQFSTESLSGVSKFHGIAETWPYHRNGTTFWSIVRSKFSEGTKFFAEQFSSDNLISLRTTQA